MSAPPLHAFVRENPEEEMLLTAAVAVNARLSYRAMSISCVCLASGESEC